MPPPDTHRLDRIEAGLSDLERRVASLEARAEGLEPAAARPLPAGRSPLDADPPVHVEPASPWLAWLTPGGGTLSLVGRTMMVLGGAFLLRAITESGSVPRGGGLVLGFGYAVVWLGVADRTAPRSAPSALFHGLAALVIGLPLLWEASIRFGTLGPSGAAPALGLVALLALAVSWHRGLPALAAVATLGSLLLALALSFATASPLPFAAVALALALVTSSDRAPESWRWLRWPTAGTATMLLALLVLRALGPTPLASTWALLAFCALSAFAAWWTGPVRAAVAGRAPSSFDVAHSLTATVVAAGGALLVGARWSPAAGPAAALLVLPLATTSYAIALVLGGDRPSRHAAGRLLSSVAALLVVMSLPALVDGQTLGGAFALLAAVFAWTGARRDLPDFLAHGALYAVAAAVAAGVPLAARHAWTSALTTWPAFPPAAWLVIAATAVGLLGPRLPTGAAGRLATAAARVVLAAVLLASLATWTMIAVGSAVLGPQPSPGAVATAGSVILAAFVVLAALAGRVHRARAMDRLVYPLLAAGAVKFVLDDVWHAGPLLLFVTLAVWGVCVMIASRVR